MNVTLSNHYITAIVDSQGAELQSLKKSDSDVEYIWKADPNIWGRHAPILFPIVGKLKDNTYRYEGQEYHLSQHGFARNMNFKKLIEEKDMVLMEMQESDETLRVYPFHFSLQISYYLWKNILYSKFQVHNTDSKPIYFSIGGHPGFSCPIDPNQSRSDHYLEFEKTESAESHILENGVISKRTKPVFRGKKIQLTDSIFDEDALILKNLSSEKVALKDGNGSSLLNFHFPNFPYLGIWSQKDAPAYVCIEPWHGLADNADHSGDLTTKEGIQKLEPEGVFTCEYGIEIE
ncbi:MAG: aldose 1-epimerase family protein [Cyclobacteriaceae bacterium]